MKRVVALVACGIVAGCTSAPAEGEAPAVASASANTLSYVDSDSGWQVTIQDGDGNGTGYATYKNVSSSTTVRQGGTCVVSQRSGSADYCSSDDDCQYSIPPEFPSGSYGYCATAGGTGYSGTCWYRWGTAPESCDLHNGAAGTSPLSLAVGASYVSSASAAGMVYPTVGLGLHATLVRLAKTTNGCASPSGSTCVSMLGNPGYY